MENKQSRGPVVGFDRELKAIKDCTRVLDALPQNERERVWTYLRARYADGSAEVPPPGGAVRPGINAG